MKYDVIIIGGGLAGLTNAIILGKLGLQTLVIEKRNYPSHKVCGEYISNEVIPFFNELGINITSLSPISIHKLILSSPTGKFVRSNLSSGGFGVSRYKLDHFLFEEAKKNGVHFLLDTQVNEIHFNQNEFIIKTNQNEIYHSEITIGSFGKLSNIDRFMNRDFFETSTPYMGVKYHMKYEFPNDEVALHNFEDGYCGVSKVENNITNVCYLIRNKHLKKYGSIEKVEEHILSLNPFLKSIFKEGEKIFDQPKVISQISFDNKKCVENHVLMSGDAAGLMAPLSGNGMAMAFHSASICAGVIKEYQRHKNRAKLENDYSHRWSSLFKGRLKRGRVIQNLFGKKIISETSLIGLKLFPFLLPPIIKNTHGKPFKLYE